MAAGAAVLAGQVARPGPLADPGIAQVAGLPLNTVAPPMPAEGVLGGTPASGATGALAVVVEARGAPRGARLLAISPGVGDVAGGRRVAVVHSPAAAVVRACQSVVAVLPGATRPDGGLAADAGVPVG